MSYSFTALFVGPVQILLQQSLGSLFGSQHNLDLVGQTNENYKLVVETAVVLDCTEQNNILQHNRVMRYNL